MGEAPAVPEDTGFFRRLRLSVGLPRNAPRRHHAKPQAAKDPPHWWPGTSLGLPRLNSTSARLSCSHVPGEPWRPCCPPRQCPRNSKGPGARPTVPPGRACRSGCRSTWEPARTRTTAASLPESSARPPASAISPRAAGSKTPGLAGSTEKQQCGPRAVSGQPAILAAAIAAPGSRSPRLLPSRPTKPAKRRVSRRTRPPWPGAGHATAASFPGRRPARG